ncbi:adenylosuccinate lyase [Candidatus Harpocratesius sp.]
MNENSIHPIEERYKTKQMAKIFTQSAKLSRWLRVESALAQAHALVGNIPQKAADEISKKATLDYVKISRVLSIEREIHHDLMAMVKGLTEQCEDQAGDYIHLGATSYDIEDTATAIQLSQGLQILRGSIEKVLILLTNLAINHKNHVCVGRTHGQQALPTTYGMRFSVWASEMARHIDRIDNILPRIAIGKMSGAVGTMASFGEKGFQIQSKVMEILSKEYNIPIQPVLVANQVIQRDRHAEVLNLTALIAGTIDKIAREMRILQRTEIGEMFEPFTKKQVGSSTMPHKRNPHKAERLCSLTRILKSNIIVGIDNIGLEDERDLTNSANERIIFAENFILLDYMLDQLAQILDGVEFNEDAITRNLNFTHGAFLAERIMVALVKKGIGRQTGHEILRNAAIQARLQKISMKSILMKESKISSRFSEEELDNLLCPEQYLGTAITQVERTVTFLKQNYIIENNST